MARGECHFFHVGCAPAFFGELRQFVLKKRRYPCCRAAAIAVLSAAMVCFSVSADAADIYSVPEGGPLWKASSGTEVGKILNRVGTVETSTGTEGDSLITAGSVGPYVLDNISIVETPGRALVIFSTNGKAVFDVSTSTKLTRKWIEVVFPGVNLEMSDRVIGGGSIIGEIYIDELTGDSAGVKVSVEILPPRIEYELYREEDSLVLRTRVR